MMNAAETIAIHSDSIVGPNSSEPAPASARSGGGACGPNGSSSSQFGISGTPYLAPPIIMYSVPGTDARQAGVRQTRKANDARVPENLGNKTNQLRFTALQVGIN
jgi:hypothetical protein